MNRSAIYIDVEGTSKIYPDDAPHFHASFDQLLSAVFVIGSKVFPESPLRLFAHQVGGDGMVVVSEFEESAPERFISIAVVLMQVLLVNGLIGKAGISTGTFSDIQGCVPSLRDVPKESGGAHRLGAGLLTTLKVMGTALINAHRYADKLPPRGSRLAVDPTLLGKIPSGVIVSAFDGPFIVDWIHTKTTTTDHIIETAGLDLPLSSELERRLVAYVAGTGSLAETDWGQNTLALNNCLRPQ